MSTATNVLLSVDDVARELTCSPIEVKRLIAWKLLGATQLGDGGEWRIDADELRRYVKQGAPKLRLPEYDRHNSIGWFENSLTNLAKAFNSAVSDAAAEQVPSDETLRRAFQDEDNRFADTLDFPIANKGKVAELLRMPPPSSMYGGTPQFAQSGKPANGAVAMVTRFTSWADLYAVELLRDHARQMVEQAALNNISSALAELYRSPGTFDELKAAAYATVSKRNCGVFSKVLTFDGKEFNSALPVNRRAYFYLPVSTFITPAAKDRLLALAF
jgi:hypothetical protein